MVYSHSSTCVLQGAMGFRPQSFITLHQLLFTVVIIGSMVLNITQSPGLSEEVMYLTWWWNTSVVIWIIFSWAVHFFACTGWFDTVLIFWQMLLSPVAVTILALFWCAAIYRLVFVATTPFLPIIGECGTNCKGQQVLSLLHHFFIPLLFLSTLWMTDVDVTRWTVFGSTVYMLLYGINIFVISYYRDINVYYSFLDLHSLSGIGGSLVTVLIFICSLWLCRLFVRNRQQQQQQQDTTFHFRRQYNHGFM
jgi:hypothetical protein